MSKCSNTRAISYTGKSTRETAKVAGLTASTSKIELSYDKGKVSVNSKVSANAGGVTGWCADMCNCYSTGTVTHRGTGNAGGLSAEAGVLDGFVKCNYSTGKISARSSKQMFAGALIGHYSGEHIIMKRNIFDNYCTTSSKAYGGADYTWKPWLA